MKDHDGGQEARRIPTWDGDHSKFEEFRERVKWYSAGLSFKDRATAGPRIAANLTGEAWRALEEINDEGREPIHRPSGEDVLI
eukprot:466182-Alexandrium_andersonii.AAC.1